jgi:hypothetical protein
MSTQSQRYVGRCTIFVGKDEIEDEYGCTEWLMEEETETKTRLIAGLKTVGIQVNADDIVFAWEDTTTGQRNCLCNCYYSRKPEDQDLDFFIDGLATFDFQATNPHASMEFYLS